MSDEAVWTLSDALAGRCSTIQVGLDKVTGAKPAVAVEAVPTMEQVVIDIAEAYRRKGGYEFLMRKPNLMRRAMGLALKQVKSGQESAIIFEFRKP